MAVQRHHQSASEEANAASYGKLVYVLGYLILGVGAIYADVMFITLVGPALPAGSLGVAAIMGAFLTSASLIALVVGKSHLFRPGDQVTWAWAFTWVEIGIMSLNVILAAMHGLHINAGYLELWLYICPASPFIAVIGWIMLIYADPRRYHLHENMAMQDQLEERRRQHQKNVHLVRLELQDAALDQQKVYMQQYMNTPEVQSALRAGSEQIALGIVSEIIERPIMPTAAIAPAKIIDSTAKKIDTLPQPAIQQPDPDNATVLHKFRVDQVKARQQKKKLPRRRFIPSTPAAAGAPKKKEETETGPLASTPLKVRRNQGPYIVNRKPTPALPVND